MTRCFSGTKHHERLDVQCDYCPRPAVYHWTHTYPDLLLCRVCLDDYPEAHFNYQRDGGREP